MPAARSRLQPEERRQAIVAAARTLYRDRPFESVSTQDLAAASGVTRGLIHHYFGSKSSLFLEVMREEVVMPTDPAPNVLSAPLEEAVRAIMEWIVEAAARYGQGWVNVSGAANLHGNSDIQELVDAADDRAARLVLDSLGLPDDPHLRAQLRPVAALTKSACREWLHRHSLTRTDVVDLLSATVLTIVAPAAAERTVA